ncbi:DNA-binding transcriptional regulator, LysR family [Methylomagnum ishizawai]|uniref:DNA-binding transcriptional regulator, LysR family n=1 Tax=Methylomagnum ishizawai TaxID=1760988 RepID=A0A1Y6CT49_9GAMM|nr:LysR family transcriptional regulator [Methylomagnum ishizawai]SMF93380.1 DNA-binding transcriptional regulator, LysR family [Methylomagnum ishizawai]
MTKLSLDALEVLEAIDRRGSFAQAAEELFRVPSALTYTVRKLEEDLGVEVFDRRGHRAKLTAAGRELLEQGRPLLVAAAALEARVKRVAQGWEPELRIAHDDILPTEGLFPFAERFYRLGSGTRLRIATEVLGGSWDALLSDRADLVVGAPCEGPAGGGYAVKILGSHGFVFAVAPHHPLAAAPEPLASCDIQAHRAVAVADSSRNLPPRSTGLLSGQDILTVPTLRAKLQAQELGLGVGYLPLGLAADALAAGRLVEKQVAAPKPAGPFCMAWKAGPRGRALAWWVEALSAAEAGAWWQPG